MTIVPARLSHGAIAAIGFLAATSVTGPAGAAERKKVAERAGCVITVGDRAADGTDRVRADCVWPVAPERVIEAVSDVGSHDDWLSSVTESTVRADGRVVQVHRASGIADRQITLDVTRETLPGGGFRTAWTRASQQVPLVKGRVDCARDDGSWEVHPATGGGARVVYSLRYDPGGSVPAWVVRAFQKGGIADLVEEMRKVVERTHSRARP